VNTSEGQPTLVARIDLVGFDLLSPGEQRSLLFLQPLTSGQQAAGSRQ